MADTSQRTVIFRVKSSSLPPEPLKNYLNQPDEEDAATVQIDCLRLQVNVKVLPAATRTGWERVFFNYPSSVCPY